MPGSKLIVITFEGRNVAALRTRCTTYQNTLGEIKSTLKSLQKAPDDDIVIKADFPYGWDNVEHTEETWVHAWDTLSSVKVTLKAGVTKSILIDFDGDRFDEYSIYAQSYDHVYFTFPYGHRADSEARMEMMRDRMFEIGRNI